MAVPIEPAQTEPGLANDFSQHLEAALRRADQQRRRRAALRAVQSLLPVLLLVSPIIGWRLMLSTPDGTHLAVAALAWITSLLDVGVDIDSAILSYLGLQALPSVVGLLLLILITGWLLSARNDAP